MFSGIPKQLPVRHVVPPVYGIPNAAHKGRTAVLGTYGVNFQDTPTAAELPDDG